MSSDEQLAERLARADAGEESWARVTDHCRAHAAAVWRDKLSTIRRAGLALVEADDGR
jgi:hypothetical protein